MSLSVGIVGLPNVGKSTLFNALTKSKQANVQNYPFCTIDPNVGVVEVPDERLTQLARVSQSRRIVPATIEFVDIAGLVKGASTGAGLGNKFLAHIREVDAIAQVVRNFSDNNIIHVDSKVDPATDAEVVGLELVLADIQTVSARLERTKKQAKGAGLKEKQTELNLLEKLFKHLESGQPARALIYNEEESALLKELHLLTIKPMLYVINIDEDKYNQFAIGQFAGGAGIKLTAGDAQQIAISAKVEAELADLPAAEAKEYLKSLGAEQSGLDKLIKASYELLGLVTFFTSGEPETRAWTVKKNTMAPQAAGVIHTDFIKGFIKADVTNWPDFINFNGWSGIKNSGKLRLEGKDYLVRDGDIIYFHVNT